VKEVCEAGAANDALSIGIVCYPGLGGSGVIASDLAVGLAARGHVVHVIATAPPTRALPEGDRIFFHEVAVSEAPLFQHPPYALAVAAAIVGIHGKHRLDLVHSHYAVPHAVSAWIAGQVLGAKSPRLVDTLHGTDVTRVDSDPAYREIVRFAVAASDGITVPSRFLRDEAYASLGVPAERAIEIVPDFVDTEHFRPAPRRDPARLERLFAAAGGSACDVGGPFLFHVSNFRAVKRMGDLIEVLARVRRHLPARLVLVGDGPERENAATRARELGVDGSVCFVGKRKEFIEDLAQADAFLLPSETESFGVAALEALSAGVPVFGYRVGGLPEVVVDGVGVLVTPRDVDALAAAVVEALTTEGRVAALGLAARAHVLANFRREPAIEAYENFYRRVLGRFSRTGGRRA
jgi:N-acetyl-alpha-D-glucosaminyl L-malate synthase BshA